MNYIESTANGQVKSLVRLRKKSSERLKRRLIIAEGERLVREIPIESLQAVYVTKDWYERNAREVQWSDVLEQSEVTVVSPGVFSVISETKSPQGILALVCMPQWDKSVLFREKTDKTKRPLLLGTERLQDPGNMGTILRTAEAAGADALIVSRDCVDLYSPKVIRAAMGAAFRLPVIVADDFCGMIREVRRHGIRVFAASLEKSESYDGQTYTEGAMFLIGNEGNGLSREAVAAADMSVRIEMQEGVESLNAAVAAAVLLFEARRQRSSGRLKEEMKQ